MDAPIHASTKVCNEAPSARWPSRNIVMPNAISRQMLVNGSRPLLRVVTGSEYTPPPINPRSGMIKIIAGSNRRADIIGMRVIEGGLVGRLGIIWLLAIHDMCAGGLPYWYCLQQEGNQYSHHKQNAKNLHARFKDIKNREFPQWLDEQIANTSTEA